MESLKSQIVFGLNWLSTRNHIRKRSNHWRVDFSQCFHRLQNFRFFSVSEFWKNLNTKWIALLLLQML